MAQQDNSVDANSVDSGMDIVDRAVAEGGAYEIIRKRLVDQGKRLNQSANTRHKHRPSKLCYRLPPRVYEH